MGGTTFEVAHTAWPIVISMLSYTAMGVVDTLFVGRLGTSQLAGVALAVTSVMLFNSVALGGLRGIKVVVAQATGAGDSEMARRSGWQGLWLALLLGGVVVLLSTWADTWVGLIGASGANFEHARVYFVLRCLSAPGLFVMTALCQHLDGLGQTRVSMRFTLLANGLNIVLDPLLIFGFGPIPAMGVFGAGLATAIAFVVAAVAAFAAFVSADNPVVGPLREDLRRLAKVGAPIGVNWLLDVAGWTVIVATLARVSELQVAANVVAIRIVSVSFLPGYGIAEATSILVGQYVGAGRLGGTNAVLKSATGLSCAIMGALGVVFLVTPEPIVGAFSSDPDVVAVGATLLMYGAAFQLFDAVALSTMGALNGAGDTAFTMKVGITATWLVLVPLGWFLAVRAEMGAAGVWVAITADVATRAAAYLVRWRSGGWRSKAVVQTGA